MATDPMATPSRWRPLARRLAGVGLVAAVLVVTTACEPPASRLASGRSLASGASMTSSANGYQLEMKADGNLVVRSASGAALWTSKTSGNAGATLVMRTTGVLAVTSTRGAVLWSTPTYGVTGGTLELRSDGNLVLVGTAGQPWWATGTSTVSSARVPLTQRSTSTHQVTLTKMYEGYTASTPVNDPGGNCVVGYGHLIHAGGCTAADRARDWDADALFAADVRDHEDRIKRTLGAVPVSQREFDALFDYAYNRGSISATSAPRLYAAMKAVPTDYAGAAAAFRALGDASTITGLCNRRYDEAQLFEGGGYAKGSHC